MSYSQTWGTNYFNCNLNSMGHPMTVSIWVKKTAAQWADSGADYAWNMAYDFSTDQNQLRCLTGTDSASFVMLTTGSTTTSTKTFTDGDYDDLWVPIICKFPAADSRTIYVENSAGAGNTPTVTRNITALDSFRLGRLMNLIGGFEGKLAEVAVWDKALSNAEIDQINPTSETGPAANTIASANCVGYWPLDTDTATHVDQSGTSNGSFTEVGTRVFDSDHPTITTAGNPWYYYAQQ